MYVLVSTTRSTERHSGEFSRVLANAGVTRLMNRSAGCWDTVASHWSGTNRCVCEITLTSGAYLADAAEPHGEEQRNERELVDRRKRQQFRLRAQPTE